MYSTPEVFVTTFVHERESSELLYVSLLRVAMAYFLVSLSVALIWRQIRKMSGILQTSKHRSGKLHSLSFLQSSVLFIWDPVQLAKKIT